MASRGTALLDNPAAASEAVADRARQAAGEHAFDVAAAQRAEDDARRLARGRDGDALDFAASAASGIRDAAGRSRAAYDDAYRAMRGVEGEFRSGAFDRIGERVRAGLPRDMPVDPVVTPAAHRALADLDEMPSLLGGTTPADVETFRRRLRFYGKSASPADREVLRRVIDGFDDHIEGAEAAGLFGSRAPALPAPVAPGAAAGAADDFPGFALSGAPDPARASARAPETLTQFLSRSGGLPLDAETRAADLHKTYIPGTGTLARKNAPSWDQIRVRLAEQGFLPTDVDGYAGAAGVRDFVLDAIHGERIGRGGRVRMGDETAGTAGREAERVADQNADYAAQVDRQARRIAIDMEGHGLGARDLDRGALNDAAEMMLRGEADDAAHAYDLAVSRRGQSSRSPDRGSGADDAPFPELGTATAPAASTALPGGSTDLTTAMRNARGLFRQHMQAFKPRGTGDDAGRFMQRVVETDMTPAEIASAMFSSATRPGERGLSVRVATRLRESLGADSPVLGAVQQGLIARAIDGNGTGDVGQRIDVLLRGNGRAAAQAILSQEQRASLGAFRAALYQTEQARQALPEWIGDLARKEFDPNAVSAGLFGSGVPGERVGSANFAKALRGFLGESSPEWSGVRQAAVSNLLRPGGRALSPAQEADRITEFASGKGKALAEHLFAPAELNQLRRYGAVLRSTALPSGTAAPGSDGKRKVAAHVLNGLLGALAAKAGGPMAAGAPFTLQVGQRALVRGPAAYAASRSFGGGAPRAPLPAPSLDLRRLGTGTGLAVEYGP